MPPRKHRKGDYCDNHPMQKVGGRDPTQKA